MNKLESGMVLECHNTIHGPHSTTHITLLSKHKVTTIQGHQYVEFIHDNPKRRTNQVIAFVNCRRFK